MRSLLDFLRDSGVVDRFAIYGAFSFQLKERMRAILNKLAWNDFDELVEEIKALPVENCEHLKAITSLIFEQV